MSNQHPNLGPWQLLPPPPEACQECATVHLVEYPHNQQSLFYQYDFYGKHGRWPTWTSAMEHCSEEVKTMWIKQLMKRGIVEYGWEKYKNDN